MEKYIRLRCASLAQIKLDDKYVLSLRRKQTEREDPTYTPIGGAVKYFSNSRNSPPLSLGFEPEEYGELKGYIQESKLPQFRQWYMELSKREVKPTREIGEELVDEERILHKLPKIKVMYMRTIEETEEPNLRLKELTHRFFDICNVQFPSEDLEAIRKACEQKGGYLTAVTEGEIIKGMSNSGIRIGDSSIYLINSLNI